MPVMGLELQENKVSKAVSLVLSLASIQKTNDVLSDEFVPLHMQIGVKKVAKEPKHLKLKLPHAIAKPDADICLFVKDLDKENRDTEPTVVHYQDILSKSGVENVKEIIPIKSLKTDFKLFEAKWNLSNAYDIYLADERVVTCLPRLLGKNFYGRKRVPTQLNILAKDLKGELHKAINTNRFTLSEKGASSMALIGHTGMSQDDITANVMAAIDQIATAMPGSSENIKRLSIKSKTSTSVPIYISKGGPQDVKVKEKKKKKGKVEIDELSTLPDAKVAVYPDGKVLIIKDGQTLKEAEANDRKSNQNMKRKRVDKGKMGKSHSPAKKVKKTSEESTKTKKVKKLTKAKKVRKIK